MSEDGYKERLLIKVIEDVLGKGHPTARSNMAFLCPFCHHAKPKLEIQLQTNEKKENQWHCWVCGKKGKTLHNLFYRIKSPQHKIQELNSLIIPGKIREEQVKVIALPKEFISFSQTHFSDRVEGIEARHAFNYLKNRNITENDIIKYNIGFCIEGEYHHRILIPSYDGKGELNYFISRTYIEGEREKYKNPPVGRNIIGLEYFINWNLPIILVEGMFDALTFRRNTIPLFGKTISEELMKRIVGSQVKKVYIALDNDALKQAIKHCEQLISFGKEVHLIEIKGKDMSAVGFEKTLDIIEKSVPLDFTTLLAKKLSLV